MSIPAGNLNRRISLLRQSETGQSPSGQPLVEWAVLVGPVWASIRPVRAAERAVEAGIAAYEDLEMLIRWQRAVADLSPKDRVDHRGQSYDILAVHELGPREALRIIARRKAD